jgi:hypothetical protein
MSKPNKYGCRKNEDVCMVHEEPLVCPHGCTQQVVSCNCKERKQYLEWQKIGEENL